MLSFQEKCLLAIEDPTASEDSAQSLSNEAPPINIRQLLLLLQKHLFAYCQSTAFKDSPANFESAVKLLQSHLLLYLPCAGEILSKVHDVLVRQGSSQLREKIHGKEDQ